MNIDNFWDAFEIEFPQNIINTKNKLKFLRKALEEEKNGIKYFIN
jgi:hypothetical protein